MFGNDSFADECVVLHYLFNSLRVGSSFSRYRHTKSECRGSVVSFTFEKLSPLSMHCHANAVMCIHLAWLFVISLSFNSLLKCT